MAECCKLIIVYSFLFFILTNKKDSYAQVINFKTDCYWIDVGVGTFNTFKDSGGLHANLNLNVAKNKNIYKVQYQIGSHFLSDPQPDEEFHSINLLIGKHLSLDGFLYIQFLTGLGATFGTLRGGTLLETRKGFFSADLYNSENLITPSIPIETELILMPLKYAQIGINLFGNINLKRPLYGLALKVGVGKVK